MSTEKLYCPIARCTCRGHECALAVFISGYTTDTYLCSLSINDQYKSQVIDNVYKRPNNDRV